MAAPAPRCDGQRWRDGRRPAPGGAAILVNSESFSQAKAARATHIGTRRFHQMNQHPSKDAVIVVVGAPQHQPTNLSDSLSLAGLVMNPERLRR